jgi:hypothetical protein
VIPYRSSKKENEMTKESMAKVLLDMAANASSMGYKLDAKTLEKAAYMLTAA